MNNRKIYTLLLIAVLGLIGLYYFNKYKVAPKLNITQLDIIDSTGAKFDWGTVNKPAIVSFYASWCGDCIKELKEIDAIKNEKLQDVNIIAVTDESMEKLISFKNRKQYPFTFLKLKKTFNEIGIHSIPVVYLLNTKQEVVYEHVGYINWSDESTLNHLKALMQ